MVEILFFIYMGFPLVYHRWAFFPRFVLVKMENIVVKREALKITCDLEA